MTSTLASLPTEPRQAAQHTCAVNRRARVGLVEGAIQGAPSKRATAAV
jgi:hypothetical protein